jgi:hypothetical protein
MSNKESIESEFAKHFMQHITMGIPNNIRKLDIDKSRPRPDYAFYYGSGQRYNLEITRWLTPEIRRLEAQLKRNVAQPLQSKLNGTYALYVPLQMFSDGKIPVNQAAKMVSDIEQAISLKKPLSSLSGYFLRKVNDESHKIGIVITLPELPPYLNEHAPEIEDLRRGFNNILSEAEEKFKGYRGINIVLINIYQSGLDIDLHAGYSSEGPGIICRWLTSTLKRSTKLDYIYVTQFRVWGGGDGNRIVTHKYIDKPSSYYRPVWAKSGSLPKGGIM